jgi:hypothetical protein
MRSRMMRVGAYSLGLAIVLLSVGHVVGAQAPPVGAPEIDGGTLASGLGLLTAGVLILRSRWK